MKNSKIFQDTVHGYISVPKNHCELIIDTEHFQRLRRIEQTSMRALYPSARHDRFIHSLGTYHLAGKAFQNIKLNSKEEFSDQISMTFWDTMKANFELASLLHDCGHSPFSHTFEKYYDLPACLDSLLKEKSQDEEFNADFDIFNDSKQHEKISALLVLTVFKESIIKLNATPIYVVRMILGCKFTSELTDEKHVINCFIELLHGDVIDVDRLDYVARDKWASGFSSTNVDLERLLSSICLKRDDNGKIIVCFLKNALSELQSVLDVKDFQSLWIFNHHKIRYEQHVLVKAIEKLSCLIQSKNEDDSTSQNAINSFFDVNTFFEPIDFNGHSIYLPTDDDLIHLMKNYYTQNEYAQEWFSRKHKLFPVWKTYAEYNDLFKKMPSSNLRKNGRLDKNVESVTKSFLKKNSYKEDDFLRKIIEPSISNIDQNQIKVFINGNIVSYEELKLPRKADNIIDFFFYLYIPIGLKERKKELIEMILQKCN